MNWVITATILVITTTSFIAAQGPRKSLTTDSGTRINRSSFNKCTVCQIITAIINGNDNKTDWQRVVKKCLWALTKKKCTRYIDIYGKIISKTLEDTKGDVTATCKMIGQCGIPSRNGKNMVEKIL